MAKLWGSLNRNETIMIPNVASDIERSMNKHCLSELVADEHESGGNENEEKQVEQITIQSKDPLMLYGISLHKFAAKMAENIELAELSNESNVTLLQPGDYLIPEPPVIYSNCASNNLNFIKQIKTPFTTGEEVVQLELSQAVAKKLLMQSVATIFSHIGYETTHNEVLLLLTDILEDLMKKICTRIKEAADEDRSYVKGSYPHFAEKVLIELGLGNCKSLHDFYQQRVIKYSNVLYKRCEDLVEDYRNLLGPSKFANDFNQDNTQFGNIPNEEDVDFQYASMRNMDEEDIIEVQMDPNVEGTAEYASLEPAFQLLNSFEAVSNFAEVGDDGTKTLSNITASIMGDSSLTFQHKSKAKRKLAQIDGANDSSDDTEEEEQLQVISKLQRRRKSEDPILVRPLNVTITTSAIIEPRQSTKQAPKRNLNKNLPKKLSFTNLSATFIEETIDCRLTPRKIEKDLIVKMPLELPKENDNKEGIDNNKDKKLLAINNSGDIFSNYQWEAGPSNIHTSNDPKQVIESLQSQCTLSNKELTRHLEETVVENATRSIDQYSTSITPKFKPPSRSYIESTMEQHKIPKTIYQEPFYSNSKHISGPMDIGFSTLNIRGRHQVPDFQSTFQSLEQLQRKLAGTSGKELIALKLSCCSSNSVFVTPVRKPPSVESVKHWLRTNKSKKLENVEEVAAKSECKEVEDCDSWSEVGLKCSNPSQQVNWENSHAISGVSLNNTHGFKMTLENLQEARSLNIYQYITVLTMELHTDTRGSLYPDPQLDQIQIIFFALSNDVPELVPTEKFIKGFIYVSPEEGDWLKGTGIERSKYIYEVHSEVELYQKFLELYHTWNPDILMGYEIEHASWGYLTERGYVLGLNVPSLLSRIKDEKPTRAHSDDTHEELHSHLKITGRIVLDMWRILKHEIALQSYTFENLAYHILHERIPHYTFKHLSSWWTHRNPKYRHRTVDYFLYRVEGTFRLIDHYDFIGRTSELARLFGILFYEVLSRGSQFRVESMMLRLAKPYRYVPVSPNVQQRAHMKAPEFLPLILEPESKFYVDPVIVLDFQSLYPSIIIAYNYCFSTCLGRVHSLGTDEPFEFGAYQLEVSRKIVGRLLRKNLITASPCGVAFVKDTVRPGIMPRMLREILDTRLMVKQSMKKHKTNKTLQKVLHSRQLGLKLIANVTYGYTAANFSGRMPAVEVGDSVVSKGRETLQRAIQLVENNSKWGARVVYGDTDSMFVLCKGKTRAEAFKIGAEIAESVTNANPSPIKLKLEKVYQPCILQTKKRYVGYMYETPEQDSPEFEAKGIETVRRDGCPAASKMLEKCLRLLFDLRDVSKVRDYVLKQFNKILTGRVSIQDLTFAKEYRGREGYRAGACVPALELSRKWLTADKRREPRSGERVPYVIINGPPGLPLIKLVRSPHDLLDDQSLRANAMYYITKAIIPPLNRCFKLIGADLFNWFNEMPRRQTPYLHSTSPKKGPKSTISQYFASSACAACGVHTQNGLCAKCLCNEQETLVILHRKVRMWEKNFYDCKMICESCCGRSFDLSCNSLDCPIIYRFCQTRHSLQQTDFVRELISKF